MARLTKNVCQKILDQNSGFSFKTYYRGRNAERTRFYTISGGQLHIREVGDTSWADSDYDREWIADEDEVHRFLYEHSWRMNLDGIE